MPFLTTGGLRHANVNVASSSFLIHRNYMRVTVHDYCVHTVSVWLLHSFFCIWYLNMNILATQGDHSVMMCVVMMCVYTENTHRVVMISQRLYLIIRELTFCYFRPGTMCNAAERGMCAYFTTCNNFRMLLFC